MEHIAEKSEELWDVYDADRKLTGKLHRRGDKLNPGEFHLVVHALIFNSKNELLIQKRQSWKKGWPGYWDVSMGGSAVAGDDSVTATEREISEELGLEVCLTGIRPRFTINFPNGFDDYYFINMDVDIDRLRLQEEEVEEVKWATQEEIMKMIEDKTFIPYFFMDHIFAMKDRYGARLYKDPSDV